MPMESSDMSLMMSVSCIALLLVVGGVVVAMNPSWLSGLFSNKQAGVIDWATGAPGQAATQSPYVYPVPPLVTQYPAYAWIPPMQ